MSITINDITPTAHLIAPDDIHIAEAEATPAAGDALGTVFCVETTGTVDGSPAMIIRYMWAEATTEGVPFPAVEHIGAVIDEHGEDADPTTPVTGIEYRLHSAVRTITTDEDRIRWDVDHMIDSPSDDVVYDAIAATDWGDYLD